MAGWWDGDPTESYWLEVTDRDDLGVDLRAPETDESGQPNWRYSLFKQAQPGDVVFHYYKPRDAIIAASVVGGPASSHPIVWGARGTFARAKGVKPHERPGYRIPLLRFDALPAPLSIDTLQARKRELLELTARLQRQHPGYALYFPFELGKRPVRPLQGYAFKLPRDFVLGFPELQLPLDAVEPTAPHLPAREPEPPAGSGGQGYAATAAVRMAVEHRAMLAATEYFEALGYEVEDVSRTQSFDLKATRGDSTRHVEVKGTTGTAETVFLTRNEVELARRHPDRATLFVLSAIQFDRAAPTLVACGGTARVCLPWSVDSGTLEPLQYLYTLPT